MAGRPEILGTPRSPILFPIVCGLWDDCYRLDGYEYKMARHGFARDLDFKLINKTDTKVTFALEDSPETHRCYPYHFMMSITYRLEGNKIHVVWHVHNTDNNEIHFQIGGHPAFLIPGMKEGDEVKGTVRFDNKGKLERLIGNMKGLHHPRTFRRGQPGRHLAFHGGQLQRGLRDYR